MENGKSEFLFKSEYVALDEFDNWARPTVTEGKVVRYRGSEDPAFILRENEDPCK